MMKKEFVTMSDNSKQEYHIRLVDDSCFSYGSAWYEANDGGLVMVMERRGKLHGAYKTFDYGKTISEEWEIGEGASQNIIRLLDGRLMSIALKQVDNTVENHPKASDLFAYFSEDDGKTFGSPVAISDKARTMYLINSRVIRLSTGRILVPVCIHPDCLLSEKSEVGDRVGVFYTDDEGITWHEGEWKAPSVADQLRDPMICEMLDGSLKMLACAGCGYLYALDSKNGGHTWSDEYKTELRSPCAPFTFSYDPYGEQYTVVWDNAFPGPGHQFPRSPICLAVSSDCKKWTMVCELGNDPMASYGYPSICYTKDALLISYCRSPERSFSDDNRVYMLCLKRNTSSLLAPNTLPVRMIEDGSYVDVPAHIFRKDAVGIGSGIYTASDGAFCVVASGGVYKSFDQGKTFEKVKGCCCENTLRLNDGRILGTAERAPLDPKYVKHGGANIYATFSYEDGTPAGVHVPITGKDGCYYLMNDRYLRTRSGRILCPICKHADEDIDKQSESAGWITCFYSDDEGGSWIEGDWVKPEWDQLCEPMVCEMRENGHIKMIARTARGYLYQCDSYDDGVTWTEERPSELRSPCAPFTIKYDPYSDKFIVLHVDSFPAGRPTSPRSPLTLSVSDDGEHWEQIMDVGADVECTYGYPVLHFTDTEIFFTCYRSSTRSFDGTMRIYFVRIPRGLDKRLKSK